MQGVHETMSMFESSDRIRLHHEECQTARDSRMFRAA
jgi:hypothetical protein